MSKFEKESGGEIFHYLQKNLNSRSFFQVIYQLYQSSYTDIFFSEHKLRFHTYNQSGVILASKPTNQINELRKKLYNLTLRQL